MTKEELVHITLRQLRESLSNSPENFRLEETNVGSNIGSTVIWQFRVKLAENQYITDPLNPVKTIIVTYNKMAKRLECYLYNREVNSLNHAIMADSQAMVTFHDLLSPWFYRTYREYMELKAALVKRKEQEDFVNYMNRLRGIFPATHEEDIFK